MSRFEMRKSADMERAIQALRTGQTRSQKDRDFAIKVAGAGGIAALTGAAGYLQGRESDQLQERQASKAQMSGAIESQTKERDRLLQAPGDYKSYDDGSHEGPEWLRGGKAPERGKDWFPSEPHEDQGPVELSLATDEYERNQDLNSAAAGATIGGYLTPEALNSHDLESDERAADMNNGKNLIRAAGVMGGMSRSLPRRSY